MNVLEVYDVSIRYMVGDFKEIGLKEYVMRKLTRNYQVREFWADQNVSFSLEDGDMLGIIGTNGAGKSTLLKAISGIMEPTKGWVKREGSIAALLELASGFDGELTVRENTYLRGAMLGYTRKFMDETYDQIIDFAELREFENHPFKQLSSGMKSRLAFSIASLVQPDILILDEVLSVGDGAFQKKSQEKMREIIGSGATTILVSHSIEQIREMCNKVLWLHKGRQIVFGDNVNEICDRYNAFLAGDQSQLGELPGIEEKLPPPHNFDSGRHIQEPTIPLQVEQPDTFDRLNHQPFSHRICNVIFGLWACCLMVLWLANLSDLFSFYSGSEYQQYAPLLILAVIVTFVFLFVWLTATCHKYTQSKTAFIIFSVALLLRLFFLPSAQFIPSSDFAVYFEAGRDFALNGFHSAFHIEEVYKIPSFAGMAVLNGIIASIFSPTILGFQVANSIMTAGICVLIYKLGVQVNEKGAIAGACLYCVYPSSILSSQMTTNQHGATLFLLLGVYIYVKALHTEKKLKKRILLAVLSAILLLISNYFHPSVIITICAILAYTVIECVGDMIYSMRKHKKVAVRNVMVPLLTLCVAFPVFSSIAMYGMQTVGFVSTELPKSQILSKVVVGLNPDTRGRYSAEDYYTVGSVPYEQQFEVCLSMITERLKNPELIPMLAEKINYYTFGSDNLFYFYENGTVNSINTNLTALETALNNKEISEIEYVINRDNFQSQLRSFRSWIYVSASTADSKFIFIVWGLAVIGLIWIIKRGKYDTIYLLTFIPMGWMMFIAITEVQSRYRYQSMPIVILMAGIGVQWICEMVLRVLRHYKIHCLNTT